MRDSKRFWACAAMALVIACGTSSCSHNDQSQDATHSLKIDPSNAKPRDEFEASRDKPMTARTLYAAGRLAEGQGDVNGAIAEYWKAVKVDPHHKDSLFRLGVLYTRSQQYSEATVAWKFYLKADDHSAEAWNDLAFCYELAGRMVDAEAAFKSGIQRDPHNDACRVNYGLMLARLGRESEAIVQMQQVLPTPQVHYNIASVYETEGRYEEARHEYQRAIAMQPGFRDAEGRLADLK